MPKCAIPGCLNLGDLELHKFRETVLCYQHYEIARVWEYLEGGICRVPKRLEIVKARESNEYAQYAIKDFIQKNVKYGALDFPNSSQGSMYNIHKKLRLAIKNHGVPIYLFRRGTTWYLVREDKINNTSP